MCKAVKSPSLETDDPQTTEKLKHKELYVACSPLPKKAPCQQINEMSHW